MTALSGHVTFIAILMNASEKCEQTQMREMLATTTFRGTFCRAPASMILYEVQNLVCHPEVTKGLKNKILRKLRMTV